MSRITSAISSGRASIANPSLRVTWLMLALLVVASAIIVGGKGGRLSPAGGDAPEYLAAAYHLFQHHTFTEARTDGYAPPAVGREPGYPLFLAALMTADPEFARFSPDCLLADDACDPRIYRSASWANLALGVATGIAMFLVGIAVLRNAWGAVIAAGYVLLNAQMSKGWADPMSDRLAVFLVGMSLLAVAWAWRGQSAWRWASVGLALGALTLTKAVFLPYCVAAAVCVAVAALFRHAARRRVLASLAAATSVYAVLAGGWALRNWAVAGEPRLTDLRGGMALSARQVFDDMTPQQYLASFVYWTRGPGEGLARRLFPHEVVAPFDLYRKGGFYDRGTNGYSARVADTMRARGIDYWQAGAIVDRALMADILARPLTHAATTLPLFYRGIWIDEFIVVGLPLLCWKLARAWRRRDALAGLLLSTGAFNLLFYAAFSHNIPRYQMTAVPAIALAAGMAATVVIQRKREGSDGGCRDRRHSRGSCLPSAPDGAERAAPAPR